MAENVKERPILFSGAMVRAILDDRKTQTRRILKPRYIPTVNPEFLDEAIAAQPGLASAFCPYGHPGQRLWVRETWFNNEPENDAKTPEQCLYRADGEFHDLCPEDHVDGRWRPSIHMPRWASRITLEVTGVRVERLHDISDADCFAEGIMQIGTMEDGTPIYWFEHVEEKDWHCGMSSPVSAYAHLWKSINGPESWAENPWLWVIEFRRMQP